MSRICVIGAGYVGLVASGCLAEVGHTVACVEVDRDRLINLQNGQMPIYEPGLGCMTDRLHRQGLLRFTHNYAEAIPDAEFVIVAVNTPAGQDGEANTEFVFAAVHSVLRYLQPGAILIVKSTVPVGTGDRIEAIARSAGHDAEVVSNPEFLREGSAIADFLRPDRIVIGAENPEAANAVAALYAAIAAPIIVCRRRSAEMAKYAANVFLAARVSLMNELAALCDAAHADVDELAQIVGSDHRIGPHFLGAGLGWGGSCFPKDVQALTATAARFGRAAPILGAVFDVNKRQRDRAFHAILAHVAGRADAVVGVLGLAFKPGTDDIREAPAIEIAHRLLAAGVHVRVHDPVAMPVARAVLPAATFVEDAYAAARGGDLLVLATEWPDYLALNWRRMRAEMRTAAVFDGRNALDRELLASLGFTYLAFGRPPATQARVNGRQPDGTIEHMPVLAWRAP